MSYTKLVRHYHMMLALKEKKRELMKMVSEIDAEKFRVIFFLLSSYYPATLRLAKVVVKAERIDLIKFICTADIPGCDFLDSKLTLVAARSGCLLSLAKLYDYDVPIHPDALLHAKERGHQRCVSYICGALGIYPQRDGSSEH